MPQLTSEHLLFCLLASLGAPLPRRAWALWRALAGVLYLAWFDPRALGALLAASALSWGLGGPGERWPKLARPAGILALLGVFVALRRTVGAGDIVAPMGSAFMLLRLIHYWVERCGGRLPPHSFPELFGWLSYLPTVLVGPLQRFDDWLRWEARHRFDAVDLSIGLRRMLYGYAKVVVLAYQVCGAWLPDRLLGAPVWFALPLTNLLVLYFTFAGLSDIAIGLGRIWGQRVPENFDNPLLQPSLPRFWQSWHISVGLFCRTYVYLPMLAATRKPLLSAAAAIAAFALWHEPTVPWLAWGAWHGLGVFLWRLFPEPRSRVLSTLLTWAWVLIGSACLAMWPQGGAWWMR